MRHTGKATAIFGIISAMFFVSLGSEVASRSLVEVENHHQLDMTAPNLWPIEPVRVDVSSQNYERISPEGESLALKGQRPSVTSAFVQAEFDVARFNG